MSKNQIYVATQTFHTVIDGKPALISAGVTRVREGHELLAANPSCFAPIEVQYDLEDASARPGRTRRAPKAEEAADDDNA